MANQTEFTQTTKSGKIVKHEVGVHFDHKYPALEVATYENGEFKHGFEWILTNPIDLAGKNLKQILGQAKAEYVY